MSGEKELTLTRAITTRKFNIHKGHYANSTPENTNTSLKFQAAGRNKGGS